MKDWKEVINSEITEKHELLDRLNNEGYIDDVFSVAEVMIECIRNGGKILTAGNGGSAADAQHFTGEIVGRFLVERDSLPAVSLVVDPVVMTCLGNDYGYDNAIARQIEGIGKKGDLLLAISTSGNSANLNSAIETCKKKGIKTVALTGRTGGKMKELCDHLLLVPSNETPRIQEVHTFTVHILCEIIEAEMFKKAD